MKTVERRLAPSLSRLREQLLPVFQIAGHSAIVEEEEIAASGKELRIVFRLPPSSRRYSYTLAERRSPKSNLAALEKFVLEEMGA